MKMKKNKKKGFTLVELLAVIVILAIILVIAVPKVMDIISDAKKGTLESTAKMIASAAEKAKVQNTVLGKDEEITCKSVAKLNDIDYATCSITFDDNGKAQVTIEGKGKFNNLYVCNGTKTNATATEGGCGLVCSAQELIAQISKPALPYEVKNYDSCMSYLRPIVVDDWGQSESYLDMICKNKVLESYTFASYIDDLLYDDYFTKEELLENNVVGSDSVLEPNITVGDYDSCIEQTKKQFTENWGYSDEEHQLFCSGVEVDGYTFTQNIQDMVTYGVVTKEELIENNVVGSDSVFIDIKLGNQASCVNYTREVFVDDWGYTEEELQTLCSGKDIWEYTSSDWFAEGIDDEEFIVDELVVNNVIVLNEEKVCVPNYANDAVTYINNLYNDTNIRSKFGLIKDNTADENIRYAGKYVQNYVEFGNTGELWRIIGTFEVEKSNGETEELVKIVRDEPFKDSEGNPLGMSWDSSAETVNAGKGINEWSQADLKNMLNTYYIGESNTCTYCDDSSQATCTNSCNSAVTPINSTYRNMIESVVWNTGAIESSYPVTSLQAYDSERSTQTGKICSSWVTDCTDVITRTTEWLGKIGLIYLSDYIYAGGGTCADVRDSSCEVSNWLKGYYWTISPKVDSYSANIVWGIVFPGVAFVNAGVRPTLYLRSDVKIIDGDGSKDNPYKLSV